MEALVHEVVYLIPTDIGLPARFSAFRSGQEDAIIDAATDERRAQIINMPTGGGKSVTGMGIASLLDARMIYVTASKGLQHQLGNDFASSGLVDIRGANNYRCVAVDRGGEHFGIAPPGTSCADAPCRVGLPCSMKPSQENFGARGCLYYDAVRKARGSKYVVTNYSYLMTANRYMEEDSLGRRDLLVLDEAHSAADELSDFMTTEVTNDELAEFSIGAPPIDDGQAAWADWAIINKGSLESFIDTRGSFDGAGSSRDIRTLRSARKLLSKLETIAEARAWRRGESGDPDVLVPGAASDWIAERTEDGGGAVFSPLWAHRYTEQYLFNRVPRIVLMSATILPRTTHYLGLEEGSYRWHEHKAHFHPERRPVYLLPTASMNKKAGPEVIRALVVKMDQIIRRRPGVNAIVHTHSYEVARQIAAISTHRVITHNRHDVREKVAQFKSRGGVIVSPSLGTGYDFPYRECELQIVMKMPFPYLGSAVIRARAKADKQYMNYLTALRLVQMSGRGMRAADDRCETFILDSNAVWFMAAAGKQGLIPGWFKAALKHITMIPQAPPRVLRAA